MIVAVLVIRPEFFLLVDLQEILFRFRVRGRKKSSECGHFQSLFSVDKIKK